MGFAWIVEELKEVDVIGQVEPDHGTDIGKGPFSLQAVLAHYISEIGNQAGPDLDLVGVLVISEEVATSFV